MFCAGCGQRVSDDWMFCNLCGGPLPRQHGGTSGELTSSRPTLPKNLVQGGSVRQFLHAAPKSWLVAATLLLLLVAIISFNSGTQQGPSTQQSSAEKEKLPEAVSNGSGDHGSADSRSTSSAVQGFSANRLLAEQLEKHQKTMDALADARGRGDFDAFERILRLRSAELAQAIDEVNTGSYSISDKQKMLDVLQPEKDWADESATALSQ